MLIAPMPSRPVRGVVLPGVFRPLSDTWLLARAACDEPLPAGARILELCAGPAFAGLTAARRHHAHLTTVDVSRRAALNARINARLNGMRVEALRGDLFSPVGSRRFDMIIANPPYLPAERDSDRATDAGTDGRDVLDRICAEAPAHLAPDGVVLIVHSEVCGAGATIDALAAGGLQSEVATFEHGTLGPRLEQRRDQLEARGLLRPGQTDEDVFVLRGRETERVPAWLTATAR
jgi:release factor glutamine methyltransferase